MVDKTVRSKADWSVYPKAGPSAVDLAALSVPCSVELMESEWVALRAALMDRTRVASSVFSSAGWLADVWADSTVDSRASSTVESSVDHSVLMTVDLRDESRVVCLAGAKADQ